MPRKGTDEIRVKSLRKKKPKTRYRFPDGLPVTAFSRPHISGFRTASRDTTARTKALAQCHYFLVFLETSDKVHGHQCIFMNTAPRFPACVLFVSCTTRCRGIHGGFYTTFLTISVSVFSAQSKSRDSAILGTAAERRKVTI
jgi:hypothetical protein